MNDKFTGLAFFHEVASSQIFPQMLIKDAKIGEKDCFKDIQT